MIKSFILSNLTSLHEGTIISITTEDEHEWVNDMPFLAIRYESDHKTQRYTVKFEDEEIVEDIQYFEMRQPRLRLEGENLEEVTLAAHNW